MTLSPDIAQYLHGFGDLVIPPPIPYAVKSLIHQNRITQIKRTTRSGLCRFPPDDSGLVEINGVWIFVTDCGSCHIIHSQFETFVTGIFEGRNGATTTVYYTFHAEESFTDKSRCIGTGVLSIQVRRRWGCWPVFSQADDARRFCLTRENLECFTLSRGSCLWYGSRRMRYVCISCHKMFGTKEQLMSHFSLY